MQKVLAKFETESAQNHLTHAVEANFGNWLTAERMIVL